MSFDKLKNLFSRTFDTKEQDSLISQASNFISSSRRSIIQNPTAQFQTYLNSLPLEDMRHLRTQKRSSKTASLKPQMVKKCYENVPQLYFDTGYEIKGELFVRNRKEISEKTYKMHQYLDEVELCLFNQISSRFDQILSVLRTIQSLECIVVYNANRLREIRQSNMDLTKQVSSRHLRIVTLLKKQERLNSILAKMKEMKAYQSFLAIDETDLRLQKSNSQHYHAISQIRTKRDLYFQLQATKHFEERVEDFQVNLKKSYSDSVNDALFKYAAQLVPYDANFWEKKFLGRAIFEDDEKEAEGTVILDESMLVEEEAVSGFNVKTSEQTELGILDNILNGWKEGQYSVGSLKAAFDKFSREKHIRFLSDWRNYAFQNHLRLQRRKIENPSIANLLRQMTIPFCSKTFVFYADMYRSMLTRVFSVVHRSITAFVYQNFKELTMEEQQKLTSVVDGLFNFLGYVFKLVYEKVVEVIDLKQVHEAMQLNDFKQIINVYQTQQEFIDKNLRRYLTIPCEQQNYLCPLIAAHLNRLDLQLVTRAKKQKVEKFLNGTHGYILENQLKESFENQIWQATDIPTFYYDSLHYLITGQSLNLRRNKNHTVRHNLTNNFESSVFIDRLGQETSMLAEGNKLIGNFRIIRSQIIIDNRTYKVTQTLLLLMQIIQDYLHLAQFYPFISNEVGVKIYQLLKAYNTSSNQLIILGGAVKLGRIKTKNITAKHLALNSLCLSFLLYIMDCISKRVTIYQSEKIRKDIENHEQTTIKKLNSILVGKINQAMPDINFNSTPTKGTESIVNNTKVLHDILADFYSKQTLAKIFTKDNVQSYLKKLRGMEIRTKMQAESLKDDINFYFHEVKFLERIIPDFQTLRLEGEDLIRAKFEDL